MRDDAKEQLKAVNARIKKAKSSFEKMENFEVPKTLQTEFADLLPGIQFPDNKENNEKKE